MQMIAFSTVAEELSAFNAWKNQQQQQFADYQTTQQRQFVSFLKTEWGLKEQESAVIRDPVPKPVVIPTLPKDQQPIAPQLTMQPMPFEPATPKQAPQLPTPSLANIVNIDFYGHQFTLPQLTSLPQVPKNVDSKSLADAWLDTSQHITTLSQQIEQVSQQLMLSDWAIYQLYQHYAKAIKLDKNQEVILIWAGITALGFDMRIAYDNQGLYLLMPALQPLYEVKFVRLAEQRFYFIDQKPAGAIKIYNNSVFDKSFDFSFARTMLAAESSLALQQRTLTDEYTGIAIELTVNQHLAQYYLNHPQVDLAWYFQTQLDSQTEQQILTQFKHILAGLEQQEKVEVLLSFVQHAFEYELDKDQWGREYYAAPQHTLGLTAVDCEDRSFLFSWLVNNLLEIETVGLLFPGHVAVAVRLDDAELDGTFYRINDGKFYIADPTYIGASIGRVMPDYANVKPNLIDM